MTPRKDWRDFIEKLNEHHVEYLIVGGIAVSAYSVPRFTIDIDFFVGTSRENGERLVAALRAFGFASFGIRPEEFAEPNQVFQFGVAPNRIDLMTSVTGIAFEEAWAERVQAEWEGVPVWFVSKRCLLANKRAVGRLKDLADIPLIDEAES
ncbi:MAG: hypothetical protein ABI823_17375 [Bryobacteraceae bacterium]